MHLDQFVLTVALHAGEADDLAGANVQRQIVDRGLAAIAERGETDRRSSAARLSASPRVLATRSRTRRPTIRLAIFSAVRPSVVLRARRCGLDA